MTNFAAGLPVIAADLNDLATRGYIDEQRNNSTIHTSTGTETICQTSTITSVGSSARYRVTWNFSLQSNVAADAGRVRIRHLSGSSLTTSGTQDAIQTYNIQQANKGQSGNVLIATITGLAAGTWTVGGTLQRTSGTGTNQVNGTSTDEEYLLVERIA